MRNHVGKKVLALALAVFVGGSLCADMTVFASETESRTVFPQAVSGTCGTNLTWKLDETTGTMTISGRGKMDWGASKLPWLDYEIKSVVLKDGITTIEYGAFWSCEASSITLPKSITKIAENAFLDCSVENIIVSSSNQNFASKKGVLYNKSCKTLLYYPGGKKENNFTVPNHVTSIASSAFYGCSLSNINIPDSVTHIGSSAFAYCDLKSVTLPRKLKKIESHTFSGSSLRSVKFPVELESIGKEAFCFSNLRTVTIPKKVKNIDDLAFGWIGLESVVLPEGLKRIGEQAFINCDLLKSLTIPESVSEIGKYAYGYDIEDGQYVKLGVKIKCYSNTAGYKYAKENGILYELLDGKNSKVKVSGIKLSGISKKIAAGKKIKLTAKVSPSKATNKSVKWTSSNKRVATVNSKGVVTINRKAAGKSVTITAMTTDGSKKKAIYKISVMKGVVKKVAISGNKPVKAGKTLKLKAKVTATKKANKTLKWTSSNKKYATVSSSGKVKTYKAGKKKKVKITAEATDGSGKKKTVTIKIK